MLLAVSEVRESDPSLLLCIIVGGGMEEAEVSADEEAARAGRDADFCAWDFLVPPWSSQTSAALSAPAPTALAAPSSTSTTLSTAGWTSLRSSVTMAGSATDDEVVRPGVPTFLLTATFKEGTPERPTRSTLTVCVSDSLFPPRSVDTHTPATERGVAAGMARRVMGGARGTWRRMDVEGWAGLRGRGAGSWEGGLRAPVTAPQTVHFVTSLALPHISHARTDAHHPLSTPFSSRVECGRCCAPGGRSWCKLPGAEPRERACGV